MTTQNSPDRALSIVERRWLSRHAIGYYIEPSEFSSNGQLDYLAMGLVMDTKGVPKLHAELNAEFTQVLAQMPEPLRYMLFPGEPAAQHVQPELLAKTRELLLKTFYMPDDSVTWYSNRGWIFTEQLAVANCINPHWKKLFARLYGLLCACFQDSVREEALTYLACDKIKILRQQTVPHHQGYWLVLEAGSCKITSVEDDAAPAN